MSARVRDELWSIVSRSLQASDGWGVLIHNAATEQGFKLSTVGQGRREITDHEGLQLVTHRSADEALWTTAEAARPQPGTGPPAAV